MECPECDLHFFPNPQTRLLGKNKKGINAVFYFQNCPKCDEFIIYVRRDSGSHLIHEEELDSCKVIYPLKSKDKRG